MKLIETLKSLFNKNISILSFQREDMVAFVKLRNNCVRINANVEVEENYNFVIVYYNKVCDILTSGNYKINEDSVPKLYRFSKTPFGLKALTTRSIDCDAYYINLKQFDNNYFKTIDRVVALSEGQKIKVKLDGTFSMKVCDTLKFMKALCNDYAVIRNKKTIKEICSTVGYEVSKALNNTNFSVDDYIFNKDKITATIVESVNNHTNTFGIEVSNFIIGEVIVNKKYLNEVQLKALEQIEENKNLTEEDLTKLVDERIDNLQKDLGVIYAGVGENKTTEGSTNTNINATSNGIINNTKQNINDVDKNSELSKSVEKQIEESANKILENTNFKKEEDIFIKDSTYNFKSNSNNVLTENRKIESNIGAIYGVSKNISSQNGPYGKGSKDYYKQPEPKILGNEDNFEEIENMQPNVEESKRMEQVLKNEPKLDKKIIPQKNDSQEDDSIKKKPKMVCSVCGAVVLEDNAKFCEKCGNKLNNYKTCACCGAKNFVDAASCCVCKSVLD